MFVLVVVIEVLVTSVLAVVTGNWGITSSCCLNMSLVTSSIFILMTSLLPVSALPSMAVYCSNVVAASLVSWTALVSRAQVVAFTSLVLSSYYCTIVLLYWLSRLLHCIVLTKFSFTFCQSRPPTYSQATPFRLFQMSWMCATNISLMFLSRTSSWCSSLSTFTSP